MMGYSYRSSEAPKMCFNAAKSSQLGWYADKSKVITPGTSPWGDDNTFTLSNIVDYATTSHDILLEISEPARQLNYNVGFNVAKGFNEGVRQGKNQVLVFRNPKINGNDSLRVADLSSGQSFTISDFNGMSGDTLTISVLSIDMAAYEAQVRVSLDRKNPAPTRTPTRVPTTAPTRTPTRVPTTAPTRLPTTAPTNLPTRLPTTAPTNLPTRRPTPSPTLRQTPVPQTSSGGVDGRNPTTDEDDSVTASSCQEAYAVCENNSDCCGGLACRRTSTGAGGFQNVCRSVAKNSKDKLPRTTANWWKRRLRGDSRVEAPLEPEDEVLEENHQAH